LISWFVWLPALYHYRARISVLFDVVAQLRYVFSVGGLGSLGGNGCAGSLVGVGVVVRVAQAGCGFIGCVVACSVVGVVDSKVY